MKLIHLQTLKPSSEGIIRFMILLLLRYIAYIISLLFPHLSFLSHDACEQEISKTKRVS